MRSLVAGNWKMNGAGEADLAKFGALKTALAETPPSCDVLVCPPATMIAQAAWFTKGVFAIGGQDCHAQPSGAFTGDISAEMLKAAGASHVIVGHSERRQYHGEKDADVAAKAQAAWRAGLIAIICIGETLEEREGGSANSICHSQVLGSIPDGATAANSVLAYEPVWAIGTGKTPSVDDIAAMHAHLRGCLKERCGEEGGKMLILYGGSVKPDNAAAILSLPDVGGALVGGASLKVADFMGIISAAPA
ncbi:MAG: triose-phosphate isomerase [Alphaproteobacteria bacterium]|nr:triose-phosphate isomerase [Alphaproteobacteria bacterium]